MKSLKIFLLAIIPIIWLWIIFYIGYILNLALLNWYSFPLFITACIVEIALVLLVVQKIINILGE